VEVEVGYHPLIHYSRGLVGGDACDAARLSYSWLTFLPPWADGNVFVDDRIVAGEERLELAHKVRGGEELLLLANHSESWQDVVVSSRRALRLEDAEGGAALGQGRSIPLCLAPAQVVFARVSRPPDGRPGVPSFR
jgi:hypothetical protein